MTSNNDLFLTVNHKHPPGYCGHPLLLQKPSFLRAEVSVPLGQDSVIWTENPGVQNTALPGRQSTHRAHGVDEETPNHAVVLGEKKLSKQSFLLYFFWIVVYTADFEHFRIGQLTSLVHCCFS